MSDLAYTPEDWVRNAVCSKLPPTEKERFFIFDDQPVMARNHCARCPVIEECFDYAVRLGMDHGLWGGVPEKQRRQMASAVGWQPDRIRFEHKLIVHRLKKRAGR